MIIQGAAAAVNVYVSLDDGGAEPSQEAFEALGEYMNRCVPFMLGLYISLTLTRWWALRVNALGQLLDAIANVMLVISSLLREPRFMPLLDQVFRYSMAVVLLVVKGARDQEDIDDLVT